MVTDDVFAVIAEATRRDILVALRKGDKAVGELVQELEASQPTISKHLKVLREADLVSMRAQGQKRYYALNPKPLAGIANWLQAFDVLPAAAADAAPARVAAPSLAAPSLAEPSLAEPSLAEPSLVESSPAAARDSLAATQPVAGQSGTGLAAAQPAPLSAAALAGRPAGSPLSPAVVIPVGTAGEDKMPQQIGRTVGRAATRAADLLANLPKFGRKK
ncbi:metalloregulator ArsR/SmtB family transcription factor [Arthrobacter sp. NicSoilB8]|uniref:ArsR/SmtB family transcription factor n=1 Tax=Arthrobacter sp. NicSoilB8 TaxID=2830998 RepID=UPI001CC6C3AD|nr:metalloregulator ArsR/SmtB family transcription factor [Arthrobacter sp. NicSoilB8]